MQKYFCLCCGYDTLDEQPPGTYNICPICDWEDDMSDGGANYEITLKQAKENFKKYGAKSIKHLKHVRKPKADDKRHPEWETLYYPEESSEAKSRINEILNEWDFLGVIDNDNQDEYSDLTFPIINFFEL